MRRFFCAAAVLALAATCPLAGWAGDREIAEQIINRLKVQRDAGELKGFKLDLKVEEGVVLLKGKVRDSAQKSTVLAAAQGLDGIAEVVDEIAIEKAQPATKPVPHIVDNEASDFSFRQALEVEGSRMRSATATTGNPYFQGAFTSAGGHRSNVATASASENAAGDDAVTASIIGALSQAQKSGRLRGFGVDVTTEGGQVVLKGQASTAAAKALILDLARRTGGVRGVVDDITVFSPQPMESGNAMPLRNPSPQSGQVQRVAHPGIPAGQAAQMQLAANYNGGMVGGGMQGQPVPSAPYAGGQAAPRYDQPYLPNYAWPGYAAYPNYAALSYPQQYSPSAWPYIGPFYPYPQVPLGWRKVSLEWDDGWWFLDFTDRN